MLQAEAGRALADGEIDAFFATVATPDPSIERAADLTDIRLIPLDSPEIRQLVADTPYYARTYVHTGY
ncbi:MAG: hypothetical protein CMM46_11255 [Rhodospirillaceae bacterium]|nr:hypothetical protein [Rhodospirillaceae bacterium]